MKPDKENVRSVKITKEFRRTYSDKNYGSISVGTGYTIELPIPSQRELEEVGQRLAERVRKETMKDLDEYLTMKEKKEVL